MVESKVWFIWTIPPSTVGYILCCINSNFTHLQLGFAKIILKSCLFSNSKTTKSTETPPISSPKMTFFFFHRPNSSLDEESTVSCLGLDPQTLRRCAAALAISARKVSKPKGMAADGKPLADLATSWPWWCCWWWSPNLTVGLVCTFHTPLRWRLGCDKLRFSSVALSRKARSATAIGSETTGVVTGSVAAGRCAATVCRASRTSERNLSDRCDNASSFSCDSSKSLETCLRADNSSRYSDLKSFILSRSSLVVASSVAMVLSQFANLLVTSVASRELRFCSCWAEWSSSSDALRFLEKKQTS